jgi:fermentation-respiration switch protein FrsA (DUF1100 family)
MYHQPHAPPRLQRALEGLEGRSPLRIAYPGAMSERTQIPQPFPPNPQGSEVSAHGLKAEPARPLMRRVARHLGAIGGVYLLWVGIGLLVQRSVVFPVHASWERGSPGADMPGIEKGWLAYEGGAVEKWFIPGAGVNAGAPAPAVIFAHGNAELIDNQGALVRGFNEMGVSVLLVEFRGYGRSTGSPSEASIVEDMTRAFDLLALRPEVDARCIVFYGRSLGGGVVCALSRQRRPAAIILQSTFTSLRAMMGTFGLFGPVVLDPMDSKSAIEKYEDSVLVMHGRADRVIPTSHGESLAAAAPNGLFQPFECGHNDFPVSSEAHWGAVRGFLERAGLLGADPGGL